MKANEGKVDQVIRIAAFFVLLAVAKVAPSGWWTAVLLVLAAISLITGLTGFCGLYALLGINTLEKKPDQPAAPTKPAA